MRWWKYWCVHTPSMRKSSNKNITIHLPSLVIWAYCHATSPDVWWELLLWIVLFRFFSDKLPPTTFWLAAAAPIWLPPLLWVVITITTTTYNKTKIVFKSKEERRMNPSSQLQLSNFCLYKIMQRNSRMDNSLFIFTLFIYHSRSGNIYNPMPSQIMPYIGFDWVIHGIYVCA